MKKNIYDNVLSKTANGVISLWNYLLQKVGYMGGRGAFKNINAGDFSFVENGQTYATIGYVDNVEILIRKGNLSIKAPEFSHTSNRIYAIINRRNQMKCLTWYDEHNRQVYSIDFDHKYCQFLWKS